MLKRCIPLFMACLFLLSACGGEDSSQPEGQTEENGQPVVVDYGEPVHGGRIVYAEIGEASNLIPQLASDSASHEIAQHLYVSLLRYDKNLEVEPWAAESYEILDDGFRFRFKLHEGIMWDDGVELTTDDVKFTYELMINPETPTAYAENYLNVKEFNVIDRYTFEVVYDEIFAKSLISWMTEILPRHILEGQDLLDNDQIRTPVSCGPYRLKEWLPGDRIVLEARDDYFEGKPYIDTMVYRVIPDQATIFLELKAGAVDLTTLTPKQYLYQTSGPQWDSEYVKYKYTAFGYTYLGYNFRKELFQDRRVRLAITHAIDKEELVKGVLLGLGTPTVGPYKPDTWVYDKDIVPHAYDPELSRRLLAEAGWTDTDGDSILDKDGKPFAFTIMTNQGNEQRVKAATIIQSKLKAIGIDTKIRTVEWAVFVKEFLDKGKFDAIVMGWNITADPDLYNVWHSSKAVEGGLNFVFYKNPELDEVLEAGRRTLDQDERKMHYDRLQVILHEDQPYCFLYVAEALPIVHKRYQGLEMAPAGISHNMYEWWVPTAMQR